MPGLSTLSVSFNCPSSGGFQGLNLEAAVEFLPLILSIPPCLVPSTDPQQSLVQVMSLLLASPTCHGQGPGEDSGTLTVVENYANEMQSSS